MLRDVLRLGELRLRDEAVDEALRDFAVIDPPPRRPRPPRAPPPAPPDPHDHPSDLPAP